jgi:hypothetical protein
MMAYTLPNVITAIETEYPQDLAQLVGIPAIRRGTLSGSSPRRRPTGSGLPRRRFHSTSL